MKTTKQKVLGAIVGLLALSGLVGANLAQAQSPDPTGTNSPAIEQKAPAAPVDPAKEAAEEAEGPEDPAKEAAEGPEDEAAEAAEEAAEGPEAEDDKHEDVGENVDHQCPPDCDTANGEVP